MKNPPKNIPHAGAIDAHYPLTTSPILGEAIHPCRPETYRLPAKGGDPYFGLTRGWYYSAEKDGLIRLIRLRKRGRQRGITLVPYDKVAAIVDAAKQQTQGAK